MSKELDDAVRRVLGEYKTPIDRDPERFKNWLAFFLIAAFVALLPLLIYKTIPEKNEQIIVYMIGQLSGMALTVLGFYYVNKVGADAAEQKRTELDVKRTDTTKAAFEAVTASNSGSNTNTISDGDTVTMKKEIEP